MGFWRIIIICAFFILSIMFISTIQHEAAHKAIDEFYGCSSKVRVGLFGGYTLSSCNLSDSSLLSYHESQSMVEAVGYQVTSLCVPIMLLLLFILISLLGWFE